MARSSYVDLSEVGVGLRLTLSPLGPPVKKSGAKKRNVDRECQKLWLSISSLNNDQPLNE